MSGRWNTTYALREEWKIRKNSLLATIPLLKKEWKVSFDFKANNFRGQVLHMTAGGKGAKYGDRTPAIWTHSSRGFVISSAVGGRYNFVKYVKPLPSAGEWTTIEIGQEYDGSKVVYSINIGGKRVFSTTNSKPSAFENVKVFASSNWYSPVSGFIKNLLIENKNNGESIHIFPVSCSISRC